MNFRFNILLKQCFINLICKHSKPTSKTSSSHRFFLLSQERKTSEHSGYTDRENLSSGIEPVRHTVTSGREWVQRLRLKLKLDLSVSNFFSALRSPRRKQLVEEISTDVRAQTDRSICHQKRAVTDIYTCNLRSHSLAHTALTNAALTKKKEHEITTLKQIGGKSLRMGEPNSNKRT